MYATSSNNYLLDSIVRVDESTGFVDSKKIYEFHANGTKSRYTAFNARWSSWKVGRPKILNNKSTFVYDEDGNELDYFSSVLDTTTWIWKDTHYYLYDERHNRVCGVRKWNEDSTVVLQGSHYYYDEDNFQIGSDQFDTWNSVQVLDYKCENTKDAYGNKIIMVEYSKPESAWEGDYMSDPVAFNEAGWVRIDSVYYTYNEKQEKTQETIYRWDNENQEWTLDGYQIFEYDAEGHCIADTVFARDFETNVITYNNMTAYIYDSHGQLSRIQMFMPNFTENGVEWLENGMYAYDYTYDENGEILQLRDYIDWQNNSSSITYYTSTYYYSEHPIQDDPEPSCITASGTCGGDLTWELTCDSVLTIKGTGMMYEYSDWNSPWRPYKDSIKSVIIEEGVTTISTAAFRDHGHLQSCILPSTIESIGNEAFCFCFQLMYIEIPPSCTSFGDGSFNLVPNVIIQDESLLPYSGSARSLNGYVEGYFVYADESKKSLRACSSAAKGEITLDDAIERIEYMAFAQCEEITNLQFGSHLQYIGEWSLNGCIGLEGLRFQEGLKEIASNAFGNCFGLQYVYLPNSLTTLGDFAIGNCPVLRTIHLGDSLRNVGSQIFDSCQGIDTIYATMTTPPVLDNTAFAASNLPGITCYVPKASLSLYQQAPVWSSMNLKAIGSFDPEPCLIASGTCGNNLTWELSCDSVLTISGTGAMTNYHTALNRSPWDGNANIKRVIFSDGVTTVGDYAFYDCDKLTSVTLPNSITYIGTVAFEYCGNLTEIEIPNSVTTISSNALAGCGFSTIFIPSSVTTIGGAALNGNKLQSINVAEDNPNYCSVDGVLFDKNKTILIKYPDGKQGACVIPSTVTSIGYLGLASGISSITCEALVPPSLEKGALVNVDKSIPLYVPSASIAAYKATAGWKDFTNIQPIEGTFPVTFLDYNGEVLSEQNVAYNQAAQAPEVPAREGYTFSGWSTDIEHIVARTFAIAIYDKIGGTLTYLSEEGDVIATENVDLHLPAAPIIAGKSFKGWLTESADSENGIVLRATYTMDNPTTHDDVTITPSSNSAYVIFPFITGALTYQLVIRDLFGNVVCKIMFSATGHLLGIAFAPSRNRESQQATQTTGFNFTVEGLDANTTYEYEFVANDDTDEVIETLSGSFTTTAEVPTDNEQVNSPSAVRKYLDDGHLMIDANSHIFDTQGKMIK